LRSVTIPPSSNAALDSVKVAMTRAKKLKGPILQSSEAAGILEQVGSAAIGADHQKG
jgi:hypothetical protein